MRGSHDDKAALRRALEAVPPGGHFFGSPHTLARYATAFYDPIVSDWRNFESWQEAGAPDTTQRAQETCKLLLGSYEQPAMAPDRLEAIDAFIAKRKEEIQAKGLV